MAHEEAANSPNIQAPGSAAGGQPRQADAPQSYPEKVALRIAQLNLTNFPDNELKAELQQKLSEKNIKLEDLKKFVLINESSQLKKWGIQDTGRFSNSDISAKNIIRQSREGALKSRSLKLSHKNLFDEINIYNAQLGRDTYDLEKYFNDIQHAEKILAESDKAFRQLSSDIRRIPVPGTQAELIAALKTFQEKAAQLAAAPYWINYSLSPAQEANNTVDTGELKKISDVFQQSLSTKLTGNSKAAPRELTELVQHKFSELKQKGKDDKDSAREIYSTILNVFTDLQKERNSLQQKRYKEHSDIRHNFKSDLPDVLKEYHNETKFKEMQRQMQDFDEVYTQYQQQLATKATPAEENRQAQDADKTPAEQRAQDAGKTQTEQRAQDADKTQTEQRAQDADKTQTEQQAQDADKAPAEQEIQAAYANIEQWLAEKASEYQFDSEYSHEYHRNNITNRSDISLETLTTLLNKNIDSFNQKAAAEKKKKLPGTADKYLKEKLENGIIRSIDYSIKEIDYSTAGHKFARLKLWSLENINQKVQTYANALLYADSLGAVEDARKAMRHNDSMITSFLLAALQDTNSLSAQHHIDTARGFSDATAKATETYQQKASESQQRAAVIDKPNDANAQRANDEALKTAFLNEHLTIDRHLGLGAADSALLRQEYADELVAQKQLADAQRQQLDKITSLGSRLQGLMTTEGKEKTELLLTAIEFTVNTVKKCLSDAESATGVANEENFSFDSLLDTAKTALENISEEKPKKIEKIMEVAQLFSQTMETLTQQARQDWDSSNSKKAAVEALEKFKKSMQNNIDETSRGLKQLGDIADKTPAEIFGNVLQEKIDEAQVKLTAEKDKNQQRRNYLLEKTAQQIKKHTNSENSKLATAEQESQTRITEAEQMRAQAEEKLQQLEDTAAKHRLETAQRLKEALSQPQTKPGHLMLTSEQLSGKTNTELLAQLTGMKLKDETGKLQEDKCIAAFSKIHINGVSAAQYFRLTQQLAAPGRSDKLALINSHMERLLTAISANLAPDKQAQQLKQELNATGQPLSGQIISIENQDKVLVALQYQLADTPKAPADPQYEPIHWYSSSSTKQTLRERNEALKAQYEKDLEAYQRQQQLCAFYEQQNKRADEFTASANQLRQKEAQALIEHYQAQKAAETAKADEAKAKAAAAAEPTAAKPETAAEPTAKPGAVAAEPTAKPEAAAAVSTQSTSVSKVQTDTALKQPADESKESEARRKIGFNQLSVEEKSEQKHKHHRRPQTADERKHQHKAQEDSKLAQDTGKETASAGAEQQQFSKQAPSKQQASKQQSSHAQHHKQTRTAMHA